MLTQKSRRVRLLALPVIACLALLLGIPSVSSAEPRKTPTTVDTAEKALARELGISTSQARSRIRAEARSGRLVQRLTGVLGEGRTGGSYIDTKTGRVVVTVTDKRLSDTVTKAGAGARVVRFSAGELSGVQSSLDAAARRSGAGKVQGWYVDILSNAVIVTTRTGAKDATTTRFLKVAKTFGQRVQVKQTATRARLARNLYGGQEITMDGYRCSSGFLARTRAGSPVMLTAGHCAEGKPTFYRNGIKIGGTRSYSFPTNDYGVVNVNSSWTARGSVDLYNGSVRKVKGFSQAMVGSSVCKSGRTTGWTCGTIQAYNQSVNYGGGDIVSGLVRHSACVEQGDSGGSNMTGNLAQGITSGAEIYSTPSGAQVCGRKLGEKTVSWYQPIGEALAANALTLITQ